MFFRLLLSSVSCGTEIQSYIIPFCSALNVSLSVQPVVTLVSINTLVQTIPIKPTPASFQLNSSSYFLLFSVQASTDTIHLPALCNMILYG